MVPQRKNALPVHPMTSPSCTRAEAAVFFGQTSACANETRASRTCVGVLQAYPNDWPMRRHAFAVDAGQLCRLGGRQAAQLDVMGNGLA